ncbi:MAG TPA: P-II family nitrogen regulator [Desulfofustis sp.]|jgi:nitrogen regulatory protein PII 2|nr:P-II family nitrogen regulator [Desulfofustis sp. PB-SRB1]HBH30495.1 P-II family nitrogen regulator [Desulfofustis sp.]
MKEVVAVVRMNKMNQTKQALTDSGVDAFFVHEAQGRGLGFVNRTLIQGTEQGYEEAAALLGEKGKLYPKRVVTVVVEDERAPDVIDAIIGANQSGKPGDGKIFVVPVRDAFRVRTGERGERSIS